MLPCRSGLFRLRSLIICGAILVSGAQALSSETLSLSIAGAKLEFVWIPVDAPEGVKSVDIGDFSGRRPKEKKRAESIYAPFERDGKRGYYLGKTEVTEEQWSAVMGEGPLSKLPVTGKTYAEVQSFLEKLNTLVLESGDMPRTPDGAAGVLRLPTEGEWEYAAREAEGPEYTEQDPYGGDLERHEVFSLPGSGGKSREVASFPPNSLGLHDMLGNVRELIDGSYSIGGVTGGGLLLKGGHYLSERDELRSSARTEHQRLGKDGKPSRRPDAGLRLGISAEIFTSLGSDNPLVAQQEPSTANEQSESPVDRFRNASQEFQKAEQLEREGSVQDAATKLRSVATQLEQIRTRNPSWQPLVVEFRLKKVQEALVRLAGVTDSSGLVPPAPEAEGIGGASSSTPPQPSFAPTRGPLPVKVMLIGDSFSVSGFGDAMQAWLLQRYGVNNIAIFASCGSSPEDWLTGDFVTDCGYRQTTPSGRMLFKYENGQRPRPVRTPKLWTLLGKYRPQIVIVQLGTSWLGNFAAADRPDAARYNLIIRDFVNQLRRGNPRVSIFWVLPPASSRYQLRVHEDIENWINSASRGLGFYTINSRSITGIYRDGLTGVDGVNYSDAAGAAWASGVCAKLTRAVNALPSARSVASNAQKAAQPEVTAVAQLGIGNVLKQEGKWDEAIAAYKELSAKYPQAAQVEEAEFWVAVGTQQKGDNEGSLPLIDAFVQKYASGQLAASALYSKASALLALGRTEEGVKVLAEVADKFPQSQPAPFTYFQRAQIAGAAQNADEVVRLMREFAEKYPQDDKIFFAYDSIGQTENNRGNTAAAVTAYEEFAGKFADFPKAPEAMVKVVELQRASAERLGRYGALNPEEQAKWKESMGAALAAGEKLTTTYPDSPALALGLRAMLVAKKQEMEAGLTDTAGVEKYFEDLAAKAPDSAKSKILFARAAFINDSDPKRTLAEMGKAYDATLVYAPADLDLYGLALLGDGKADEARAVFEKIAADYLNPEGQEPAQAPPAIQEAQAISLFGLGRVAQEKGDIATAGKFFEKLKSLYPWSSKVLEANYGIAASLHEQGKADEAVALLTQIIRAPNASSQLRADAMLLGGYIQKDKGERDAAIDYFIKISAFYDAVPEAASTGLWEGGQLLEQQVNELLASDPAKAQKQKEQMLRIYKILAEKFPDSKYAPQARERISAFTTR